ncbi:MAG: hypothetical protein WAS91_03970, partial [Blautia wexlerae]
FIICAVLIIKSFHTQLSLLRSRSAYDKVIYCQSFLQTGSYVLYFIIWTCGEIVKQKKYSSFVKSKCNVGKNDYKSESQVADDDKIVTFTN